MSGMEDRLKLKGRYDVVCLDADGNVRWREVIDNAVVTVGKNSLFDNFLSGSAFTQTGPYMGLISSVSFTSISVADTMASHAGWLEAGGANLPTYSGTRPTCVFSVSAGGTKQLTAPLAFTMTAGGTVEGCFLCLAAGATNVVDSTTGTLFSAGVFASGAKLVNIGDVLNVSWSLSA